MPESRLERRLMDRLHGQLDAWQPSRPDPAQARYRHLAPSAQGGSRPLLKGVGFGFAAGVVATAAALVLLSGSVQPQVWLDRAQGDVRHLEEDIVESRQPAASPQPSAADLPSPPSTRAGSPAAPIVLSTPGDQRRNAPTPAPPPTARPAPTPSPMGGDGGSGGSGSHDGGSSTPSPSPSPTSSDGGSEHR